MEIINFQRTTHRKRQIFFKYKSFINFLIFDRTYKKTRDPASRNCHIRFTIVRRSSDASLPRLSTMFPFFQGTQWYVFKIYKYIYTQHTHIYTYIHIFIYILIYSYTCIRVCMYISAWNTRMGIMRVYPLSIR